MISVIVPVYNTPEPLLRACLDSVLGQSFTDWEMIIVDDGSVPATARYLDTCAATDPRIRVIHQKNGGISVARNIGLRHSRGQYLTFVDSDDMLHPRALENWADIALRSGARLVMSDSCHGSAPVFGNDVSGKFMLADYESVMRDSLYQTGLLYSHSPWAKLYEKSLFDDLQFREGIIYEDLDLFYRLADFDGPIAVNKDRMYFYRKTPGSYMHTWITGRLNVLAVVDRLEAYMAARHPALLPAAADRKLSANFNMFILASKHHHPREAAACWRVIKQYRRQSLVNPNVRIKNKAGIILSCLGRKVFEKISSRFY